MSNNNRNLFSYYLFILKPRPLFTIEDKYEWRCVEWVWMDLTLYICYSKAVCFSGIGNLTEIYDPWSVIIVSGVFVQHRLYFHSRWTEIFLDLRWVLIHVPSQTFITEVVSWKCLGTFTTIDYLIKTESVKLCNIPASWYSILTTLFLSSTLLDHKYSENMLAASPNKNAPNV